MADQPSIIEYFDSDLFLAHLREKKGYSIGVGEFQEVNRLLLRLAAIGRLPATTGELARMLGPLLCKTTQQQRHFAGELTTWLAPLLPAAELPPAPEMQIREVIEAKKKKSFPWRLALGILVGLAVIIATYLAATSTSGNFDATTQTEVPVPSPNNEVPPALSLGDYLNHFFGNSALALSLPENWQWYGRFLGLLLVLSLVIWQVIRRILSRVPDTFLRRMPRDPERPFDINRFFLPTPDQHSFLASGFVRTAKKFNNPVYAPSADIDTEKTLEATLRKGGHFEIIRRLVPRSPEYLVLIDRKAFADHQAAYVRGLIDTLAGFDVPITVLYFDGDPRNSYSEDQDRVYDLAALAKHFGDYNLLVFASARELLDARSLEPAPWVSELAKWPEAALFTPETPAPASGAYRVLEDFFELYPATWLGLEVFVSIDKRARAVGGTPLPSSLTGRASRWLDEHPPDASTASFLVSEVRDYLGNQGFLWFCACAVYPALNWHLTLTLGQQLYSPDGKLFQHDRLLRLIQLPWFRHGRLPDWLRIQLLENLPETFEQQVRQAIYNLFVARTLEPAGSFQLEVGNYHRPGYRFFARRLLKTWQKRTAPQSGVNDLIFTSFMEDRLAVRIPQKARAFERPTARKEKAAPAPPKPKEASEGFLGLSREYWEVMGITLGAEFCFALLSLVFFADIHQTGISTPTMATVNLFALALAPLVINFFSAQDNDSSFQKYDESLGIIAGLVVAGIMLMIPWKYTSYAGWFFLIYFFGLFAVKVLALTREMLVQYPLRTTAGYLGLFLSASMGLWLGKLTPLIPFFAFSNNSFAALLLAFGLSTVLLVISSARQEQYGIKFKLYEDGNQPWSLPFTLRALSPRDPDRLLLLTIVLVILGLSGFSTEVTPFLSVFEVDEIHLGLGGLIEPDQLDPAQRLEWYLSLGLKLGTFLAGGLLCFLFFGVRKVKIPTQTLLHFVILGLGIKLAMDVLMGLLSQLDLSSSVWLLLVNLPDYFAEALIMVALLHFYTRLAPRRHLEFFFGLGFLGYTLLVFLRRLVVSAIMPTSLSLEGGSVPLVFYLLPLFSFLLLLVLFIYRRRLALLAPDGEDRTEVNEEEKQARASALLSVRRARKAIGEADLPAALEILEHYFSQTPHPKEKWMREFDMTRVKYSNLEKKNQLGLISSEESLLIRNQLTRTLLDLIEQLEAATNEEPASWLSRWWQRVVAVEETGDADDQDLENVVEKVNERIVSGRTEEALKVLETFLEGKGPSYQERRQEVLLLSARFQRLKIEERNGMLNSEEAQVRRAQIYQSILQITSDLVTSKDPPDLSLLSRSQRPSPGGEKVPEADTQQIGQVVNDVKKAIGEAKLKEALAILETFLARAGSSYQEFHQQVMLLLAQLRELKIKELQGYIPHDEARLRWNRLTQSILQLTLNLEEEKTFKAPSRVEEKNWFRRLFSTRQSTPAVTSTILPILERSKSAIGEGNTKAAIQLLREYLEDQGAEKSDPYQQLVLLGNRLGSLEKNQLQAVISTENYHLEINRIRYDLLQLIEQFEEQATGPAGRQKVSPAQSEGPASTSTETGQPWSAVVAQVRQLIMQDDLREALDLLANTLAQGPSQNRDQLTELTMLRSRYTTIQRNADRGLVSIEDYQLEKSRIREGLLELLELAGATGPEKKKSSGGIGSFFQRFSSREQQAADRSSEARSALQKSGRIVKEFIGRGEIEKAIKELKNLLEAFPEDFSGDPFNQLLLLSARQQELKRNQLRGVISHEIFQTESYRINEMLLELLESLEE